MLTCEEALERMCEALDAPLPLEERQELEEHLAGCLECREAYEALVQTELTLRELGETPAPPELAAHVMARIQAEAAQPCRSLPFWRQRRWRNLAGLAACAVLCVGLYYGAELQQTASDAAVKSAEIVQEAPDSSAPQTRDLPQEQEEFSPAEDKTAQEESQPADSQDTGAAAAFSPPSGGEVSPAEDMPAEADGNTRAFPAGEVDPEPASQEVETDPAASQESEVGPAASQGDDAGIVEEPPLSQENGALTDEDSLDAQLDQQEYAAQTEGPAVTAAVPPPWGEGTALVILELPEEAQALLPAQEEWSQEEDGTLWCTVTAQELSALQAALTEAGVETQLPEEPWTEPCALVILPAEELPAGQAEPSN